MSRSLRLFASIFVPAVSYMLAFGSVASAADVKPIYKARPAPAPLFTPKIRLGVNFGGTWLTDLPTHSSSGFYRGNIDTGRGSLIGASAFVDVAKLGSSPALFRSWVISVGVVVESMRFGSLSWHGLCGGAPCFGTGSLNQFNIVPEIKAMTDIAPGLKVGAYIGVVYAHLRPQDAQPTGAGGPLIISSDRAWGFAFGAEAALALTNRVSLTAKVGTRWIGETEYDTTLIGERFLFDRTTELIVTIGLDIAFDYLDWALGKSPPPLGKLPFGKAPDYRL
jgi:hypothetical protein